MSMETRIALSNSPSPFLYWRNYYFWLWKIMFKKRWLLLEHNWYENSSFSFPWMPNCLTWRAPLYLSVWWLFLLHSAGIFLSKEKKKWLKLNNIWFFLMINNNFFFFILINIFLMKGFWKKGSWQAWKSCLSVISNGRRKRVIVRTLFSLYQSISHKRRDMISNSDIWICGHELRIRMGDFELHQFFCLVKMQVIECV